MSEQSLGKILIVDDEVELKNALVDSLTAQSFVVRGFIDPQEALAVLKEEEFDVVLSDLMMPQMDGIALVTAALEIDPYLVPIIMTGQGTIQTAVDAMKAGTFDYVLKPFRMRAVMPVLTRALNTRHLRLENIQLREAVAIHELSETIAFTLDPKTVLSKLADAALLQSDADEVSVLLPVENTQEFYVAAVRGEKRERLLGERVPFGDSIAHWVAREHEPLIIDGEVDDDRFVALWPRPEIRSSVSIPMLVAKKLVGVLNLNHVCKPRRFTFGQMKALTILAGTAAAALESASLYATVRKTEEEYRSIFENAVEGIFRSVDERYTRVNPAMALMFGYDSPEQMVAEVTDMARDIYVNPEERQRSKELENQNGFLKGFVFEAHRRNGEKIWVSLNRRPIFDDDGVLLYREGTLEDITEQKRAEDALRASEAEMRALFAAMRDVIIVLDLNGRYVKIAPTDGSGLYMPMETLLGKTMHEVLSQEEANFFLGHVRDALGEQKPRRVEYKLTVENKEVWFEGTVSPMTEDSVIWVARDVTERKRALEQLEESELRFRQLAENINEVFWIADPAAGEILYVSPAYEQIWNRRANELYGNAALFVNAIHPDDQPAVISGKKKQLLGESSQDEYRIRRPDGTERWISDRAFPIKDKDENVTRIVGIAEDITERKAAEANLRESEARYRELFESNPYPMWVFDLETLRFLAVNDAAVSHYGYSRKEFLAMTIQDIRPPEDMSRLMDHLQREGPGRRYC